MKTSIGVRHDRKWGEEFLLAYVSALNRTFRLRQDLGHARRRQEYDETVRALKRAEQQCRVLHSLLFPRAA